MLKLRISFIERPVRAITGRSATKSKLLVRETSELQRTKPAWQPMKLARQLREAVVRYVPAIEFYGLNGFGWSDDIFEPNPPPNDDFVRKNARVLMEELKDVEYATDSDDDSGSDDNITTTLVSFLFIQLCNVNGRSYQYIVLSFLELAPSAHSTTQTKEFYPTKSFDYKERSGGHKTHIATTHRDAPQL